MSVTKQYYKTKPYAKVTFRISGDLSGEARTAGLAGDFNDWDIRATPMKPLKDGGFSVTVNLEPGRYQYRFVLDGHRWVTDDQADDYVYSDVAAGDNAVVEV